MFGLMRHWLKEKEPAIETLALTDLHVGCTVGFGFMPQKNVSGRRLKVSEANSYLFDDDNFLSFRLEDEDIDINLIVAQDAHSAVTYLALSQPIKEALFGPLFVTPTPLEWFELGDYATVDVASRMLGAPKGWLAPQYRLVMKTRGHRMDGDFRLREPLERRAFSRAFDYVLLVDDDNNHALEAERYEDGTLQVYATVYRPASDIGEIEPLRFAQPSLVVSAPVAATPFVPEPYAPISPIEQVSPLVDDRVAEETIPVETAEPEEEGLSEAAVAALLQTVDDPSEALSDATQVHGKFGRIQPVNFVTRDAAQPQTLAFDTRLAGKIIAEAQRNQMALSELIRKVIDLPARIEEKVFVPFELDDAEYAELARRYEVPVADREAVQQKILEDLRLFIGDKKVP